MKDKFWAYKVDPKERSIQHLELSQKNWFDEMKEIGGFRLLERYRVSKHPIVEWWGDEEGRFNEDNLCFDYKFIIYYKRNANEGGLMMPYSIHAANNLNNNDFEKSTDWDIKSMEFVGTSFFIGPTINDRVQSIQMNVGEFASCIEFGFKKASLPDVSFELIDE